LSIVVATLIAVYMYRLRLRIERDSNFGLKTARRPKLSKYEFDFCEHHQTIRTDRRPEYIFEYIKQIIITQEQILGLNGTHLQFPGVLITFEGSDKPDHPISYSPIYKLMWRKFLCSFCMPDKG